MYLKRFKITNFRKFGVTDNEVEFVASKAGVEEIANKIASSTTLIVGKNNAGKTTITKALQKLVYNDIKAGDFNYQYLKTLFGAYKVNNFGNYSDSVRNFTAENEKACSSAPITFLPCFLTVEI
jgi:putative ATP-dependent endonuclease of the OLD family